MTIGPAWDYKPTTSPDGQWVAFSRSHEGPARIWLLPAEGGRARPLTRSPYDDRWFERPSLDHRVTTKVDVRHHYGVRRDALLAHATQVDPTEKFWFGLPDEQAADAYPYEDYILAQSHVETDVPEGDLLSGLTADEEAA